MQGYRKKAKVCLVTMWDGNPLCVHIQGEEKTGGETYINNEEDGHRTLG